MCCLRERGAEVTDAFDDDGGRQERVARDRGRGNTRYRLRAALQVAVTSSTSFDLNSGDDSFGDMTDNFAVAATPQAHDADIEFFVRRGMTKGYQLLSLLTPPVYAVFAVSRYGRSHLSVNRILRATWMGGSAGAYSQILSST